MSAVKSLGQAFDDLYDAFASVPAPVSVPHCNSCCVSDEEMAELLAFRPLREIPREVLQSYMGNLVVRTAGSPPDSQYFFPRILELVIGESIWPEFVHFGEFMEPVVCGWPRRQRAAIRDVLRALFGYRLTVPPYLRERYLACGTVPVDVRRLGVSDILCVAAQFSQDLRPFLAHWAIVMEQEFPAANLLSVIQSDCELSSHWGARYHWPAIYWWRRSRELRYAVARRLAAAPDDEDVKLLAFYVGVSDQA